MDDLAMARRKPLKVGVAGLGLIGRQVLALFRDRKPAGLTLHAVAVRNREAARVELDALGMSTPLVSLAELVQEVDVVVETTRAESLREVVEATFRADKTVVIVSGSGLVQCQDLLEQSSMTGRGRLIVASGSMPGLDSVRTAAEAGINSVSVQTRYSVPNMSEHLRTIGIDASQLKEPLVIFRGNAKEAAEQFPRHYNVGAALMVACGPEVDIKVELIVDPATRMSSHHIEIETPAGEFTLESRAHLTLPTRGSRLVAPSVMACLRRMVDPLSAGS